MRIKELYATKHGAYRFNRIMQPTGLLWHSTGADNPWVMRYAGDSATQDPLIGANPNSNGFQQNTDNQGRNSGGAFIACSNAVMGLGTDGKMLTVKTLPDNYCPWCSGSGNLETAKKNGFSGNNANFLGYYQLEVCEDLTCAGTVYGRKNPYSPKEYAELCYNEMVAFSVEFFKTYLGGDSSKVTAKTLTSHVEAHKMGIASNHGDPWHWLGKYGYSGDTLRNAVKAKLRGESSAPTPPPSAVSSDNSKGSLSKIDISSYDAFRSATFGKLFDVDSAYGNQCWDAAALLWTQLSPPRTLSSGGTGAARGCWEVEKARKANAGSEFELIADVTKIKRGDVIVFGTGLGHYGHIGFADEDYKTPKIATYSQNQGGTSGKGQAAAFSVKSYNSNALIGAFRFKRWSSAAPTPVPTPPPAPATEIKVGSKVKLNHGSKTYTGGNIAGWVYNDTWIVAKIGGDRVVIDKNVSGTNSIMTPVNAKDLTPV